MQLNTDDIRQDQLLAQTCTDFILTLMPSIHILPDYISLLLVTNLAATAA